MEPKYKVGDRVWLLPFEENDVPRQRATILTADVYTWGISYVMEVEPEDRNDDGLRDVPEEQIEGYVES